MKKSLIIILAFTVLFQHANAQQTVDKVIAVIGNEAILLSDIEEMRLAAKIEGRSPVEDSHCAMLEDLLTSKLLVAQAKLDSLKVDLSNADNMVERQYKYYVMNFGNDKAIEEFFQRSIEKIKEEWFEQAKENTYAQTMMQEITGKLTATPSEVENFYKKIPADSLPLIPDQYVIYQIVKKPNSSAASLAAKQQLLELRKRILAGERFQSLATLYSEDPGSARRGGEVGLSPMENWVPPIREILKNMRPGQVSQIVESEYGYHIVQLIEKQANNLVNYRHILIKPKYTAEDRKEGFMKLDSIVRLIKADSITFEKAALYFSDDEQSKMANGLLINNRQYSSPSPRFIKDELNPDDYQALKNLPNLEMSEPFESTNQQGNVVYKVIMVKNFIPAHTANLKDDYDQLYNATLQQKQAETISKWVKKKQKAEYVRIDDSFKNCKFDHEGWVR
ncbi:MAG: peptidylprolyl isomerase [Prevotellaceae bacterium]|nr:peptidylprolyl isomerase [Prevotellaceae bacterium]